MVELNWNANNEMKGVDFTEDFICMLEENLSSIVLRGIYIGVPEFFGAYVHYVDEVLVKITEYPVRWSSTECIFLMRFFHTIKSFSIRFECI